MKNIHLIPTDKPTGIFKSGDNLLFSIMFKVRTNHEGFHIYITNNEEKLSNNGDYYLGYPNCNTIHKWDMKGMHEGKQVWIKKIILTTDQDLIDDGVQAIDDEFLEWFVNNPSCEEVEVQKGKMKLNDDGEEYGFPDMSLYKIIIPKEELNLNCFDCNESLEDCTCMEDTINMKETVNMKQNTHYVDFSNPNADKISSASTTTIKQETLEEAAKSNYDNKTAKIPVPTSHWINSEFLQIQNFKEGAKWQSEKMYSEEELGTRNLGLTFELRNELKQIISQSTPLIPEIETGILENIPVIKRLAVPNHIWELIDDIIFGDNRLNAFQKFRLVDRDVCALEDETPAEIVTKWLRSMHITEDSVLFDMTW